MLEPVRRARPERRARGVRRPGRRHPPGRRVAAPRPVRRARRRRWSSWAARTCSRRWPTPRRWPRPSPAPCSRWCGVGPTASCSSTPRSSTRPCASFLDTVTRRGLGRRPPAPRRLTRAPAGGWHPHQIGGSAGLSSGPRQGSTARRGGRGSPRARRSAPSLARPVLIGLLGGAVGAAVVTGGGGRPPDSTRPMTAWRSAPGSPTPRSSASSAPTCSTRSSPCPRSRRSGACGASSGRSLDEPGVVLRGRHLRAHPGPTASSSPAAGRPPARRRRRRRGHHRPRAWPRQFGLAVGDRGPPSGCSPRRSSRPSTAVRRARRPEGRARGGRHLLAGRERDHESVGILGTPAFAEQARDGGGGDGAMIRLVDEPGAHARFTDGVVAAAEAVRPPRGRRRAGGLSTSGWPTTTGTAAGRRRTVVARGLLLAGARRAARRARSAWRRRWPATSPAASEAAAPRSPRSASTGRTAGARLPGCPSPSSPLRSPRSSPSPVPSPCHPCSRSGSPAASNRRPGSRSTSPSCRRGRCPRRRAAAPRRGHRRWRPGASAPPASPPAGQVAVRAGRSGPACRFRWPSGPGLALDRGQGRLRHARPGGAGGRRAGRRGRGRGRGLRRQPGPADRDATALRLARRPPGDDAQDDLVDELVADGDIDALLEVRGFDLSVDGLRRDGVTTTVLQGLHRLHLPRRAATRRAVGGGPRPGAGRPLGRGGRRPRSPSTTRGGGDGRRRRPGPGRHGQQLRGHRAGRRGGPGGGRPRVARSARPWSATRTGSTSTTPPRRSARSGRSSASSRRSGSWIWPRCATCH